MYERPTAYFAFLFNFNAGGSDLRFNDGFHLKTYLKMRELGLDVLSVVEPTWILGLELFYFRIQLYILLSSYLCFISFFVLIYIYSETIHQ